MRFRECGGAVAAGRSLRGFVLTSLSILPIMSCDEGVQPDGLGVPAAMLIVGGQNQMGTVGQELSAALEIQVVDAQNQPVRGQIVNFRVTAGGGSVFAGAAITTQGGIAKERWTLGTVAVDTQRIEARSVDPNTGQGIVFAEFKAVGTADIPASVEKLAGDAQTIVAGSAAPESLTVRVKDQYGNVVPGAEVTWSVGSGGGTVSPTTSTTNADGIARTRWTGATSVAGNWQVTANVTSISVAFSAAPVGAAPAQLVLTQSASGAPAGSPFTIQPQLRILDVYGNVASHTAPVSMTVSGGASATGTTTVSPATPGVVVFANAGVSGLVGTYTLTYTTAINGAPATATQEIIVVPGAPYRYALSSDVSTAEVGSVVALQAQLKDVAGNDIPTSGRSVTWTRLGAGGAFNPATTITNASGSTSTAFSVESAFSSDSVRVSATDASVTGFVRLAVTTGPPTKLSFASQPSSVGYSIFYPLSVAVQDQFGNTVTSDTRTVTLTLASAPPGATIGGNATVAASAGVARFNEFHLETPGDGYAITASASGVSGTTTSAFSVTPTGLVLNSWGSFPGMAIQGTMVRSGGGSTTIHGVLAPNTSGLISHDTRISTVIANADLYAYLFETGGNQRNGNIAVMPASGPTYNLSLPGRTGADLAFDGTYFYVGAVNSSAVHITASRLLRVDANTGARIGLFDMSVPFTVVSTTVYYLTASGLYSVPRDSGAATLVGAGSSGGCGGQRCVLSVNDTLYWATGNGTAAAEIVRDGIAIVTGLSTKIWGFRADGDWLYFIDNGDVKRFSRNPAVPINVQTIVTGASVSEIDLDSNSLYYVSNRWMVLKRPK